MAEAEAPPPATFFAKTLETALGETKIAYNLANTDALYPVPPVGESPNRKAEREKKARKDQWAAANNEPIPVDEREIQKNNYAASAANSAKVADGPRKLLQGFHAHRYPGREDDE